MTRAGLRQLAAAGLPALVAAAPIHADAPAPETATGWSGTAGAGPIVFPRYAGGRRAQAWPIPLLSATYGDAVYIEPLRAGAYLWGSADKTMGFGLAVEPRMGFKAGDAPRLAGMASRRDSLEGGPAFDWDLGPVAFSASLFTDLTHSSQGGSGRLYLVREWFRGTPLNLGAFAGAERLGERVATYFFGIDGAEASAARPAYRAPASTNLMAGAAGGYRLGRAYSVVFGLQTTRLSGGVAHSPIVETRLSSVGWLGLAFNL